MNGPELICLYNYGEFLSQCTVKPSVTTTSLHAMATFHSSQWTIHTFTLTGVLSALPHRHLQSESKREKYLQLNINGCLLCCPAVFLGHSPLVILCIAHRKSINFSWPVSVSYNISATLRELSRSSSMASHCYFILAFSFGQHLSLWCVISMCFYTLAYFLQCSSCIVWLFSMSY